MALFIRGDNNEIVKIHWQSLKIFFFRTTGFISTRHRKKHPLVKGIQVSLNEGPCPFRGEIILYWHNLKIFFSRNPGLILTKLGTKHPWVNEIQFCSREGPCAFPRGDCNEIVKIYICDKIKKIFSSGTHFIGLIW